MFSKDLKPFYESITIKPLLHDHTVKSGESMYRVERWFWADNEERLHAYIFIDITINAKHRKNPFAKTPSTVVELLKSKKIVITNSPY